jgi:predicted protein tyrosine phosphatase
MTITICRADELLGKVAALKPAAVLSIEHPGVKEGEKGYAPRLKDGTPQLILTFWDSEKVVPNGPDREQIKRGIEFVLPYVQRGENVIIHCQAGIARSAGVALGVLSALHPDETPEELINTLLALRPIAGPNILVVGIVDELTGRHGTLVQAVLDNPQLTAGRQQAASGREEWYRKQHPEKFPPLQKPPKP